MAPGRLQRRRFEGRARTLHDLSCRRRVLDFMRSPVPSAAHDRRDRALNSQNTLVIMERCGDAARSQLAAGDPVAFQAPVWQHTNVREEPVRGGAMGLASRLVRACRQPKNRLNLLYRPTASDRTVVFLGKRGVGKSSTVNRLFALSFATDPAVECTRKPNQHRLFLADGTFYRVVDMPGIAANLDSDRRYVRYYRHWLGRADVIVWITQADVRAYKQDERFFLTYTPAVHPATRLVLGISKIDTQVHYKGPVSRVTLAADTILQRKISDVRGQIASHSWVTPERVPVVAYSVARDWNIDVLYETITIPQPVG